MRALVRHNMTLHKHEPEITAATLRILSQRSQHHGVEHAMRVVKISDRIVTQMPSDVMKFKPTVRICALAHDIGDGKFNDDTPKWLSLLQQVPAGTLQFVIELTKRVSLSRELVHGRTDWVPTLGAGVAIRAIVSDADKLDSLGIAGYQRLQEYNREKLDSIIDSMQHSPDISIGEYNSLLHDMIWLVITRRQRNLAAYMQTRYGRDRAPELFRELVGQHRAWVRSVNLHQ